MKERIKYLERNFYNLSQDERKYLDMVIRSILGNSEDISDTEKKLLIKYAIAQNCKFYGYPIVMVDFQDTNNTYGGYYSSPSNKIIITNNTLNDEANSSYPYYADTTTIIDRLLLTSFHECEHYFQYMDFSNGILNKRSYYWTIYSVLNSFDEDEYKRNYNYKQIENQANIMGWYNVGLFYARMGLKIDSGSFLATMQAEARENMANQKDEKRMLIADYNVSKLVEICYSHPSVVDTYPLLKQFFYDKNYGSKRGLPIDITTLIDTYNIFERHTKSSSEKQDIYLDFFTYYFSKDASKINGSCDMIALDLISREFNSLSFIFDSRDFNRTVKEQVTRIKVGRILTVYDKISELNLLDNRDEPFGSIGDILKNRCVEMLKNYETSKSLHGNDPIIEDEINKLKDNLSIGDVHGRDARGRVSVINI